MGQTNVMAYSALVMTAANFGLNYLLVFGKFGFPAMGIGGAGLATALSEGLGLAVYLWFLWRNGHLREYQLLRPRALDHPLVRTILNLSLPSILQGVVSMASFYLFFLAVERMGEHDLAVTQLVRNLFVLLMVPTWGLSAATNAIISNLIGQGLKEQVLPTLRRIIFISWGCWVLIAVPLLVFPHAVMQVYTPDVRLMADALPAVYFVVFVLLLFQPAWLSLSAVQGTGATRMALYFELSTLVFYLGYIWVVTSYFTVGVLEVWYAEAVYDMGLLLLCQFYLRRGAWRQLKV
jgi:Na+-driven multidrug efflux pump